MKFTLGWLKEYLDTNATVAEIGEKLTSLGLELESIEDRAAVFKDFKVAHIVEAKQHPDADRLKVLIVDTGDEKLQVVCGAPNARSGMKGIFAPDGSFIPGTGAMLKKSSIRGQESNGMMVSEREMGLSDEHNGIIDLPSETKIGTPFAEIFGLGDPAIDIAVTPNRADCAGVRGVARDLAASGIGELKPLNTTQVKGTFKNSVTITLETASCPHFAGRYIRNVKNGPSPDWLVQRLKAVGLRPISALVDITNYFSLSLCRPLHVFDADKLNGNITVRPAKRGETLDALNDKTYTLEDGMTVVCDELGLLGLGGIMGGKSTSVSDDTVNVYIEAAYFDPFTTAKTGRALEIISDARYRFERGIDPAFTETGMELATRMVLDLCGGEASEVFVTGQAPVIGNSVSFDPAYTEKLSGVKIDVDSQLSILRQLGFEIDGKVAPFTVKAPSWRGDIMGRADLVEEITRVYGFDHIPALSLHSENAVPVSAETTNYMRSRKARTALASRGFHESVTWSFMKRDVAALFGSNDNPALALTNPISSDLSQMRPSILPNLIEAAQKNADRALGDLALFEVGPIYVGIDPDAQRTVAAGIRFGARGPRHWSGVEASRMSDALDAKADALAALEAAGAPASNLQVSRDAPAYYHPGRSGSLRLGANVLGYFGEIHPAVLETLDVKAPVAGFEVFLGSFPAPKKKGTTRPPLTLSPFQPVSRDFAFVLDDKIDTETMIRAARGADKMIDRVEIFDVYQGKGVADGKKSVAVNVIIQPKDATLTDAQIESIAKRIVEAVTAKCGAILRG